MLVNSCKKDKMDLPVVTTADVTGISYSTATSGGNVLNDGGDSILARGICWSTSAAPTQDDHKTTESGSLGDFVSILSQLDPDTKYFVRAYATNGNGTGYGNQVSFSTSMTSVPDLTTAEPTYIGQKSAFSGGFISSDNGSSVVARGVCWSLTTNPTTSDSKSSSGSGTGEFSSLLTGLTPNSTYYVRAYANNSEGTSYGNEIMFSTIDYGALTDLDGNSYKTIIIGTQEWMAENLKTTKYGNGDSIPKVSDDDDWKEQNEGAYCWYDNSEVPNKDTYGALYNWFAVSDYRNICPQDWHVPNDEEWIILTDFLTNNGYGFEGSGDDIAKSMASTSGWTNNSNAGTVGNDQATNNSSGFAALPGGVRIKNGVYAVAEYTCSFWSATDNSFNYGNALTLTGEFTDVSRGYTFKQNGASVRCLSDN